MQQILLPTGELVSGTTVDFDRLVSQYRAMLSMRVLDRKCVGFQKLGRLATYAPLEGQEACQVGSVSALEPEDWLVASYRDAGAMVTHGYPTELLLAGRRGDERGGSPPPWLNIMPPSITVGAHMLHAVGISWAERFLGRDRVALTMFGDGATSEGDFHEAMNFAAVYQVGVVFFCQNNGYAISTPLTTQTAAASISDKAIGYGMEGVTVDGNDVLAVTQVTKQAVDKARRGGGPTLIEALTYRIGPHTTTDNPSRYRQSSEEEVWKTKDPLRRVRTLLTTQGLWTEADQASTEQQAASQATEAMEKAEALGELDSDHLFSAMYAQLPSRLMDQAQQSRTYAPN